jgi:hypothetical protein
MSETRWSVDSVLASLETQAAFLREREAFHAAQEAHHREQRATYAAESAETDRRLAAFRAAAAEALELAARQSPAATQAAAPEVKPADLGSASRPKLGRMVALLLAEKDPAAPFGPAGLAREVNHRFADRLRRPVTAAQMSIVLRRLHRRGTIHQSRPGRPHGEALYTKQAPEP